MKKLLFPALTCATLLIAALFTFQTASAVPARKTPFNVVQPNGDSLTVYLVGDENWHCNFTADGYLVAPNAKGAYCYAKWSSEEQPDRNGIMRRYPVPTRKVAHNASNRKKSEMRWLQRKKIPTKNVKTYTEK